MILEIFALMTWKLLIFIPRESPNYETALTPCRSAARIAENYESIRVNKGAVRVFKSQRHRADR